MGNDTFDEGKCSAFLMKVMEHNAAAMTVFMCSLGDRLGLFSALATTGAATSEELADRAHIDQRYAREWLLGMHSAGYLEHDPESRRFILPREYRPVLVKEGHPFFLGAFHEHISALYPVFDKVEQAFRTGEGIDSEHYNEHFSSGLDRATHIWVERLLTQSWIPAIPRAQTLLEQGATAAEMGCGSGLALVKLAETFGRSRFVGYDIDPVAIERAEARAAAAEVSDRVSFEVVDITKEVPGQHDFVACFDVLHDVSDPAGTLAAIHKALRPEGVLLVGEWAVEDDPDEDANPLAATMYGFSIMYCVPTTLARGGEALGTLGLPEPKLRELAQQAGFSDVTPVSSGHPILGLYSLTP